jgi:hypothetical protein
MARTILTTCHGIVRIRMLTYIYMSMKEGLPTLHIILYEKAELKKQPPINFRQIKNIKSEREREREGWFDVQCSMWVQCMYLPYHY